VTHAGQDAELCTRNAVKNHGRLFHTRKVAISEISNAGAVIVANSAFEMPSPALTTSL
jgi:hypothetical protein